MKKLIHDKPFVTESGDVIPDLVIAYNTYGTLNDEGDNVIWVCHALTANSEVEAWWPGMVGKGLMLDTSEYFIVCANILGSCYGTTGPADIDPQTGKPWLKTFPSITIRDVVNVHEILRKHLGISGIHTVIGSSIGGFQALEYSVMHPDLVRHLVFIASSVRQTPWAIAFNEAQRLAMEADESFRTGDPEGGQRGLKAARAVALLSYRSAHAYNLTQKDDDDRTDNFRASSYQAYQGDKLVSRFNPYSFYCITKLSDTHNIGRGRGGTEKALSRIRADVLAIGISSDFLFPPADPKFLADNVEGAEYIEIDSLYGHDGFLIETELITSVVKDFWKNKKEENYDKKRA
ncbi:homoserine O-acetyltransferase [bacterium]|nr:homoserine O-acetyltransferase [bacterium]